MLLAIDTSTAQLGLALYDGVHVLGEYAWRSSQRHTVELAPAVSNMLARSGLTMDAIQVLGVALGPGSFTSLRVGLSLAKGLALARQLPMVGVSTLDVVAATQPIGKLPLVAAIQAGRARLAIGWYKGSKKGWQAKGLARVVTTEELMYEIKTPSIVAGEFTMEDRQRLMKDEINVKLTSPAHSVRRPSILAELAWGRWQNGDVDDDASLAPIYLHTSEPIVS